MLEYDPRSICYYFVCVFGFGVRDGSYTPLWWCICLLMLWHFVQYELDTGFSLLSDPSPSPTVLYEGSPVRRALLGTFSPSNYLYPFLSHKVRLRSKWQFLSVKSFGFHHRQTVLDITSLSWPSIRSFPLSLIYTSLNFRHSYTSSVTRKMCPYWNFWTKRNNFRVVPTLPNPCRLLPFWVDPSTT